MIVTEPRQFKRDHNLRKLFFTEESFNHKARANLYWLGWLINQYALGGEICLDPMAGAGSILLGAMDGRSIMAGDIEWHWAALQNKNLARIQAETLFVSPALVAQWDATKLPIATRSIPIIITSPPYYDLFSDWNRNAGHALDGNHVGETGQCYGFHAQQIGNIHIYDDYLSTMRQVYAECWRVLRPAGIMVLIVGNRVKNKRIVTVTEDTAALVQANGFNLLAVHKRKTLPSQFRLIAAQHDENYPMITDETAMIFQKRIDHRPCMKYALVQAPAPNSAPGQQLFSKQLQYCRHSADQVLIWTNDGLSAGHGPNGVLSIGSIRARDRKEFANAMCRDLITKFGLAAGDEISLHLNQTYAHYLQQRLEAFGILANMPAAKMNFGKKLTWYTLHH